MAEDGGKAADGRTLLTLLAIAPSGGSAQAIAPLSPWDGMNPFQCTIQDPAQGTQVPDPGADPSCVRSETSNQYVTALDLVTFPLRGAGSLLGRGAEVLLVPRGSLAGLGDSVECPDRGVRVLRPLLLQ